MFGKLGHPREWSCRLITSPMKRADPEVDGSLTLQITLIKIERVTFGAFLAVAQSARRRALERACFTRRVRIASGRSLTKPICPSPGAAPDCRWTGTAFTEAIDSLPARTVSTDIVGAIEVVPCPLIGLQNSSNRE